MSSEAIHLLGFPKKHVVCQYFWTNRLYVCNATHNYGALTASAFALNWMTAFPFPIYVKSVDFDAICYQVNTAVAGGLLGLAIYDSKDGFPNKFVVDVGDFDCSNVGAKYASISTVTLKEGLYYQVHAVNDGGIGLLCKDHRQLIPMFGSSVISAYQATGLRASCVWDDFPPATFGAGVADIYYNPIWWVVV